MSGFMPRYVVRRRDDEKNWPIGPDPHGRQHALDAFNSAQKKLGAEGIGPFMFADEDGLVPVDFDLIETSDRFEIRHHLVSLSR
jgi:hypothetical protein